MFGFSRFSLFMAFMAWMGVFVAAASAIGLAYPGEVMGVADKVRSAAILAADGAIASTRFLGERPLVVIAWSMIVHYIFVGMRELRHALRWTHRKGITRRKRVLLMLRTAAEAGLRVGIPVLFVLTCDIMHIENIVEPAQASVKQFFL